MDGIAHLMVGILIYKMTGNIFAIPLSLLLDIDHIIGFAYDKRKKIPIKMPRLMYLAYRPRSWLHSIVVVSILAIVFSFFLPWNVVFLSLFSHLFLDAMDKHGIYLLPIGSKKRLRGILPVGYLMEDPSHSKRHKRSHIPSALIVIVIVILLIVLKKF